MTCESPGHVLWFHSHCHPDAGVEVGCLPGHTGLLVVCRECGADVAALRLSTPISADAECVDCAACRRREELQ